MLRNACRIASLGLFLTAYGASAPAQYVYPPGYGAWGWDGWGASTVTGDEARGLGVFARGVGEYNLQTARTSAINADTAARWNEYVHRCQQVANRRHYAQMTRKKQDLDRARAAIERRLREEPTASDIARGDALNVALDELTSPKVYARALKGAGVKVGGEAIRVIPFRYASEAITASVHNLTEGGPPASLKTDDFASEREGLKAIAEQLREQDDGGRPDPERIAKAKTLIKSMQTKAETKYPAGSRERSEATRHLKALYGLASMLETPAINVLLAGVEKRPDATLGDLLGFMHAFNLRFGPATTPRQRAVYDELHPLLDKLRDEVAPGSQPAVAEAVPDPHAAPGEFFEGMEYGHLDARKGAATEGSETRKGAPGQP